MSEAANTKSTVVITGPELAEPAMLELGRKCRIVCVKPYASSEEISQVVAEEKAAGLIVRMGRITASVIEASSKLQVIAKHGTGTDNIDKAAATEAKVAVMITPTANFESVAEHTLALMLAVSRGVVYLDGRMRAGHWDKSTYKGVELFGKTLGIVGYGRIGRRLAELVQVLEMKVLFSDPIVHEHDPVTGATPANDLEHLLAEADFLSLCCPLTEQTADLLSERQFKLMKNTAWLVNTARGGVVDERALERALENGEIAGAALDTFAQEPPDAVHPLARFDNVILTPHIGGVSRESFVRMGMQAVKNVLDVLEGKPLDPACLINPEVL